VTASLTCSSPSTWRLKLNPKAKKAHLTGWLKSSQAFIGEDRITIVH